jgi:hypothetical protein
MRMARFGAAVALGLTATAAEAGPYADLLGRCMVSKTTPQDQLVLVRWIVKAFSSHPAVSDAVTVDPAAVAPIQSAMAAYTERLFLADCLTESREAARYEGEAALVQAFGFVSSIAGGEVTASPEVAGVLQGYIALIDQPRLEREIFGR